MRFYFILFGIKNQKKKMYFNSRMKKEINFFYIQNLKITWTTKNRLICKVSNIFPKKKIKNLHFPPIPPCDSDLYHFDGANMFCQTFCVYSPVFLFLFIIQTELKHSLLHVNRCFEICWVAFPTVRKTEKKKCGLCTMKVQQQKQ